MGDYGRLITPPIQLQRKNFREMCTLIGVKVKYQYPLNLEFTNQGEIDSSYSEPEDVWCVFTETLDQKTQKLLGWNAELDTEMSVISLPYDLHDLQVGCTVVVPSAFDNTQGRKFRIAEISAKMIYPASVTCRLAQEYETTMEKAETMSFVNTDFNLLNTDYDEI